MSRVDLPQCRWLLGAKLRTCWQVSCHFFGVGGSSFVLVAPSCHVAPWAVAAPHGASFSRVGVMVCRSWCGVNARSNERAIVAGCALRPLTDTFGVVLSLSLSPSLSGRSRGVAGRTVIG